MTREFTTVGVVGLGTMGAGIAEVFARTGLKVIAVEVTEDALARGRGHVEHSTDRALRRGKLDEAGKDALFAQIEFTTSLQALAAADLVIEAVPERMELKAQVFAELDRICPPETILASNTSSLSVTELSVHTSRPGKVVGMHFFNPAPVLKLVEVIRTVVTEPEVVEDVTALAERLGKVPVVIGDRAGFIANALLFGYLNHAVRMFEGRYATREDLDAAMKLGCGYPMGPLALLDLIGLDTAYEILDTMYHQSRNRLHAPAPLLKQMITAGLLGRKTGRGFYTYDAPDSPTVVDAVSAEGDAGEQVREVQRVGVVGTGTMATGIVEVFAKSGHDVIVRARSEGKGKSALEALRRSLDKGVLRGKLTEGDRDAALARVQVTTDLGDLADADLVVEAVAEELSVKKAVFATLDEVCKPGAVLATTTSSLPVIELAAVTSRPGDVVGLHFFNPAPVMKLVEVVHTISTAPEVVSTAQAVCRKLGKHPVTCGDRAGFIVNALLFPYLNDAVKMLEAHYASADDIDNAMKVGCGLPMGPFALLDVVGLDVALAIQRELYLEFREAGFAPAPLLEHLVTAGRLGRKTGKGFRDYTG
ncbi:MULTISPECIES: 3-hydroxybutyryl-CoA dehydrogenase [unclassified Crossiella]|uniref:3-hydroxyacyl-CoA dehydrogenase family protein n=1 Tax=unclassified Crossiella TaxID=2620835 RepID=UPI001FFED8F2|nr:MULTISPECIES: 3-hydroxybutyryl-CoA dehydrogenase [unclassified Crossiella]MCK2244888.1 3-hydroxybutyryl-CoA dehydrogenase [Crossiella sp. S99.2]MCK2258559.1 3-hydroxybutyryl-CoA dehydrogenase [Crossiella sp. S99.1]